MRGEGLFLNNASRKVINKNVFENNFESFIIMNAEIKNMYQQ